LSEKLCRLRVVEGKKTKTHKKKKKKETESSTPPRTKGGRGPGKGGSLPNVSKREGTYAAEEEKEKGLPPRNRRRRIKDKKILDAPQRERVLGRRRRYC